MICTVLTASILRMEWLEGEGALKGRDKVILHEHAVQGILHLQASKRLENTQGCVYQTAQKKNLRTTHIVKTRRRVSKLPQPFRVGSRFAQIASKSRNDFLGIKGRRQASEASQNPQAPSKLTQRRGLGLAFPPLPRVHSSPFAHHARGKRS